MFSISAVVLAATPVATDLPPAPMPAPMPTEVPAEAAQPAAPDSPAVSAPPGDVILPPASGITPAPEANEIIVSGEYKAPPGDPLEQLNAKAYDATQAVDDALVEPLAKGYEDAVPKPVRSGLRNFLRNLKAPIIAINFLLQLKPGKAAETIGRFAINSTIGLGGFIDVAEDKPFNLPFRPNGFADTLGYYGVGPGPYFFLPLIGPTTLRDLVGGAADAMVLPIGVGGPFKRIEYSIPSGVVGALDYRIEFDDQLQQIRAAEDPYTAERELYLKTRQAQIDALKGIKVDSGAFTVPAAPAGDAPVPADPAAPVEEPEREPELED